MARRLVDLSVTITTSPNSDPWPPTIRRTGHRQQAQMRAPELGISPDDFPGGLHLAVEELTIKTHVGTHVDAPWHYGPTSEGKPARTIPELPLEWFFGPGVRLDFTHLPPGSGIDAPDIAAELERIGHTLRPLDIVLIQTGAARLYGEPGYFDAHSGLTREAVFWLTDRGVKVIGTDAYGLDKPFDAMVQEFRERGVDALFPSHYAGREREYCQIEKLCNLEALPHSGFTVAAFPVKVEAASGGWARVVAIIEE